MSILIKDVEMPERCAKCFLKSICDKRIYMERRPENCPLIELPPHGRLIDADALMDALTRAKEDDPLQYKEDYLIVSEWLCVAPTIIPAEPCNDLAKPNNDAEEGE